MNAEQKRNIRIPTQLLNELRQLAHVESLRRMKTVTWCGLLREAAQKLVSGAGSY
jgi:hypothetical protein